MLAVWQSALFILAALSMGFTIYYSVKYRRRKEARLRGLYASNMNIWIGILLVCITLLEWTYPYSLIRTVVSSVFLLLGLFNLFSGIRNHSYFKRA